MTIGERLFRLESLSNPADGAFDVLSHITLPYHDDTESEVTKPLFI
jgi:hypothetical protein